MPWAHTPALPPLGFVTLMEVTSPLRASAFSSVKWVVRVPSSQGGREQKELSGIWPSAWSGTWRVTGTRSISNQSRLGLRLQALLFFLRGFRTLHGTPRPGPPQRA